jgi:ADP-heptose:LPS heptosyltransferase
MSPSGSVKILVIKPSSLGDIIHGLQVATALKVGLPDASIDWVVRDCFAGIVRASPVPSHIFLFHRGGGLGKFIPLLSEIRKRHYDYVLDMQGLARSGIMTRFSSADIKIGRSDAREFSWLAYDKKIPLPSAPNAHAVDILLQFLPEFGLPAELRGAVEFSAIRSDAIGELLRHTRGNGRPGILLFPESRRREKEWPHFRQLSAALAREFPRLTVTIVAQNKISGIGAAENLCNLSGNTSIEDMAWLVQNCSVVVANDSAPVHLAAALKVPVVALFGPTDPQKFGPYPAAAATNFVLRAPTGKLRSLTVDAVLSTVTRALEGS